MSSSDGLSKPNTLLGFRFRVIKQLLLWLLANTATPHFPTSSLLPAWTGVRVCLFHEKRPPPSLPPSHFLHSSLFTCLSCAAWQFGWIFLDWLAHWAVNLQDFDFTTGYLSALNTNPLQLPNKSLLKWFGMESLPLTFYLWDWTEIFHKTRHY